MTWIANESRNTLIRTSSIVALGVFFAQNMWEVQAYGVAGTEDYWVMETSNSQELAIKARDEILAKIRRAEGEAP